MEPLVVKLNYSNTQRSNLTLRFPRDPEIRNVHIDIDVYAACFMFLIHCTNC
jgi:hypothetical protein